MNLYITNNSYKPQEPLDSFSKQLNVRMQYAKKAVSELTMNSICFLACIPIIIKNVLVGGSNQHLSSFTFNSCLEARFTLSYPAILAIRVLNPQAHCVPHSSAVKISPYYISLGADGFLPEFTTSKLKHIARDLRKSENILIKQIATRAIYAFGLIICPLPRLGDTALAVIAVPIFILTMGKSINVNHFTYRVLQGPGLLDDINYFSTHLLNPWV